MAKFPIQYSQKLPPGEAAAVPARPISGDVRIGASAEALSFAQTGGSLAKVGEQLVGMALKIQDQKDSLDFSAQCRTTGIFFAPLFSHHWRAKEWYFSSF